MTREKWDEKVNAAYGKVDAIRRDIRTTQDKLRDARVRCSAAELAFKAEFPVRSHEDIVREMSQRDMERKEANKAAGRHYTDNGQPERQHQSIVDATAAGMSGGNKRAGGGRSFGRVQYAGPRGYTRPKLPSEL